MDKVDPSKLKYSEVQKSTYEQTFSKEKDNLRKQNRERKEQAYNKSKPTISGGERKQQQLQPQLRALWRCVWG